MSQSGRVGAQGRELERRFYVTIHQKFVIATACSLVWFMVSCWLAQPWIHQLSDIAGPFLAYPAILLLALIPGFLNAHTLITLLLDTPPPLPRELLDHRWVFPPISILVDALSGAEGLPETLLSLSKQDYPAPVEIIVLDDSSAEQTIDVLKAMRFQNFTVVHGNHGGKAGALSTGLNVVTQDITVCIDANTYLQPQSLKRIVARLLTDPPSTAAVAGCVLVRNSRASMMTRLQEWDYFLGISSAKRQQALYQGTVVAQGAFSAFKTAVLRQCEGWEPVVGEDIVLTWKLLSKGYRVGYEPTALCFTDAPTGVRGLWKQRQRWARGMVEGLKRHGSRAWQGNMTGFSVGVDFVTPVIELIYSAAFLPGVILAMTGRYYIAAPMAVLVLPLAFLIAALMLHKQKQVFEALNLKVRRNSLGFLAFMFFYQPLLSPICITGYLKEMVGARRG
jgi:biofilm PGA synthesis N-glycosyltransferase PgaC